MSFDVAVEKRLGEAHIALAFRADAGLTALFGPSGSGKTSVLNMIAGLLRPDRGHIRVAGRTLFGDGVDLPPERRHAGYVFQEARLFPHLSVRGNLRYGQRGAGWIGLDEVASRACSIAGRAPCRAGRRSASRSAARCCRARASCCSTSRSPRSTPRARTRSWG